MLKSEKKELFEKLLHYCHNNENAVYKLINHGEDSLAYYDTDYESDNELDETEPGYEEYQCLVFKNVNTGNLFEISYHSLPDQVYDGSKRVI